MISCNLLYLRGRGGGESAFFNLRHVAYDSISLALYQDFWFLEIRFSRSYAGGRGGEGEKSI